MEHKHESKKHKNSIKNWSNQGYRFGGLQDRECRLTSRACAVIVIKKATDLTKKAQMCYIKVK